MPGRRSDIKDASRERIRFQARTRERPTDGPSVIALIREVKSGTQLAHTVPACARTRHLKRSFTGWIL